MKWIYLLGIHLEIYRSPAALVVAIYVIKRIDRFKEMTMKTSRRTRFFLTLPLLALILMAGWSNVSWAQTQGLGTLAELHFPRTIEEFLQRAKEINLSRNTAWKKELFFATCAWRQQPRPAVQQRVTFQQMRNNPSTSCTTNPLHLRQNRLVHRLVVEAIMRGDAALFKRIEAFYHAMGKMRYSVEAIKGRGGIDFFVVPVLAANEAFRALLKRDRYIAGLFQGRMETVLNQARKSAHGGLYGVPTLSQLASQVINRRRS